MAVDQANKKNNEDRPIESDKQLCKKQRYKIIRVLCCIGFFVFTALFLNEVWLQPFLANRSNDKAKSLYQMPTPSPMIEPVEEALATTDIKEPSMEGDAKNSILEVDKTQSALDRDYMGRLPAFRGLLEVNPDVKGWIKLNDINGKNDTKIDYVVVQSGIDDPEYYLTRDWLGNKVKSGSLFLDIKSSVEKNTQNLVIHGHNMTSTDDMFHYLLRYNNKEFYDTHPIIDFNTIYQTGQWKVFAVFITNGSSEKEPLFDYTISEFKDRSKFLEFVYQIRIRSIYKADDIDINETDQLLTLSTCSYEVKNYRTVIVARKVRDGENPSVDTDLVHSNPESLYPDSFYYRYGGKAPKLPKTFQEALAEGEIPWYKPIKEDNVNERKHP